MIESQADDGVEPLNLEDLVHSRMVWEDADGNRVEGPFFECNDPQCKICKEHGGT